MVITELDKEWCRAQTREWIRDGKLAIRPCAICGDPLAHVVHLDWSIPTRIVWLCKTHRKLRRNQYPLSGLQRALLGQALAAYESQPEGDETLPSFRLDLSAVTDLRKRESRRAAAGLALKRLIRRGLLGRCGYGEYCITADGVETARRLDLTYSS